MIKHLKRLGTGLVLISGVVCAIGALAGLCSLVLRHPHLLPFLAILPLLAFAYMLGTAYRRERF